MKTRGTPIIVINHIFHCVQVPEMLLAILIGKARRLLAIKMYLKLTQDQAEVGNERILPL